MAFVRAGLGGGTAFMTLTKAGCAAWYDVRGWPERGDRWSALESAARDADTVPVASAVLIDLIQRARNAR